MGEVRFQGTTGRLVQVAEVEAMVVVEVATEVAEEAMEVAEEATVRPWVPEAIQKPDFSSD